MCLCVWVGKSKFGKFRNWNGVCLGNLAGIMLVFVRLPSIAKLIAVKSSKLSPACLPSLSLPLFPSLSHCKLCWVSVCVCMCVCFYVCVHPKVESMKIATPTLLVRQLDLLPSHPLLSSPFAHTHTHTHKQAVCARGSCLSPSLSFSLSTPVSISFHCSFSSFIAVQFVVEIVLSDSWTVCYFF